MFTLAILLGNVDRKPALMVGYCWISTCFKTGEDRSTRLCRRAITVIGRQLRLRERLAREGRIDHDRLFFTDSGRPIPDLKYQYTRWHRTLRLAKTEPDRKRRMTGPGPRRRRRDCLPRVRTEGRERVEPTSRGMTSWPEGDLAADLPVAGRA